MLKLKLQILACTLLLFIADTAQAQPDLGMVGNWNSGINYLSSIPSTGPGAYTGTRGNGCGYYGEAGGSVIGFFYSRVFPKSKLIVGDYLGAGLDMDYAKFESHTLLKYLVAFHFCYGVQAGYAITKNIDAGIRIYKDARLWFLGNIDGQVNTNPLMMGACARYTRLYADVAFGSETNKPEAGYKYTGFTTNIRCYLKKPSAGQYLGLRIDKMNAKFPDPASLTNGVYRTDHFTTIAFVFGIMY